MSFRSLHRAVVVGAALCAAAATAQVPFRHLSSTRNELPAPTGSQQQTVCLVGDFDLDRRDDFIVASRQGGGKIELWRSLASGFVRSTIDASFNNLEAGGTVFDVDRDGDLDFVIGDDWNGRNLYWWENPQPNITNTWTRRILKSGGSPSHHDQAAGDFDGDGQIELVSWNQGAQALLLFEVPANPRAGGLWQQKQIWRGASTEGLSVGDVDGNGVVDIVGGGRYWTHTGGGNYAMTTVNTSIASVRTAVGQIIPGGYAEIVLSAGDAKGPLLLFTYVNNRWVQGWIDGADDGHSLELADFDGDGNLDIMSGQMRFAGPNCQLRVFFGDGRGNFRKQVLSTGNGIHEGRIADLDGDGDPDIVHKPYNDRAPRVEVWINDRSGGGGGSLPIDKWARKELDSNLSVSAFFVRYGDLDGDGDLDLATGDAWYRNSGTAAGNWQRVPFAAPLKNVAVLHDFDGDGDLDVLGTQGTNAGRNPNFAWADNDGRGNFTVRTNIAAGSGDFLQGVEAARFGGSGSPIEVALSWHSGGGGVQMLTVPSNPRSGTWGVRRISTANEEEDLSVGDIDGDGDLDLYLGTKWLEYPSWAAHSIGTTFDLPRTFGLPKPDRNELADMDRDGDLDAIVSLEDGQEVLWFQNPGGRGSTGQWPRHIIGLVPGQGFSMDVGDIDADGDVDVVVGEHKGAQNNRVVLLLNEGRTTNWRQHTVDNQPQWQIDHHDGTQFVDIDRDGDLDIASIGWNVRKLWLFENRAKTGGGGGGGQVQRPTLSPNGAAFRAYRSAKLEVATQGAELRYTTDGSDPTTGSRLYQGPLVVGGVTQLKVRAFKAGMSPSDIASAPFAAIADDVARWRFDTGGGTWTFDDGANALDVRLLSTNWVQGQSQYALDFNGSSSQGRLPKPFDLSGNRMSISSWVRADNFWHVPNGETRILTKATGNNDNDHYWALGTRRVNNEVRVRFLLKAGGWTSVHDATSGSVPTGSWAHVAATYDGGRVRLYLDGAEVGSFARNGAINQNGSAQVWIGAQPPFGGRGFDGRIDDLRVFSRALSGAELAAMAAGRPLPDIFHYGRPTRACAGAPGIEAVAAPKTGAFEFGLAASGAPTSAPGVIILGVQADPVGSLVLGARLHVGVQQSFLTSGLSADAGGRAYVPLPLSRVPPNVRFRAQFLWANPWNCSGPFPLSASDALDVVVR